MHVLLIFSFLFVLSFLLCFVLEEYGSLRESFSKFLREKEHTGFYDLQINGRPSVVPTTSLFRNKNLKKSYSF